MFAPGESRKVFPGKADLGPLAAVASFFTDRAARRMTKASAISGPPLEIAAIGDSLSTGFHVCSTAGMVWRARTRRARSWFLDTSGSIDSLCHRLAREAPIIARQYATVSAAIDNALESYTFAHRLIGTRHFSQQVTAVRELQRFPDLVLVWIGHNNLDWVKARADERENTDALFDRLTDEFIASFRRELLRLIDRAGSADHDVAIVVFGLIDFNQFFTARAKAERRRSGSPTHYERLTDCYKLFGSMRPEHRAGMIELAARFNRGLMQLVDDLGQADQPSHVAVDYSSALTDAPIAEEESISHVDAWHPSTTGHNILAASAYEAVAVVLESQLRRRDNGAGPQ